MGQSNADLIMAYVAQMCTALMSVGHPVAWHNSARLRIHRDHRARQRFSLTKLLQHPHVKRLATRGNNERFRTARCGRARPRAFALPPSSPFPPVLAGMAVLPSRQLRWPRICNRFCGVKCVRSLDTD